MPTIVSTTPMRNPVMLERVALPICASRYRRSARIDPLTRPFGKPDAFQQLAQRGSVIAARVWSISSSARRTSEREVAP